MHTQLQPSIKHVLKCVPHTASILSNGINKRVFCSFEIDVVFSFTDKTENTQLQC